MTRYFAAIVAATVLCSAPALAHETSEAHKHETAKSHKEHHPRKRKGKKKYRLPGNPPAAATPDAGAAKPAETPAS